MSKQHALRSLSPWRELQLTLRGYILLEKVVMAASADCCAAST